MRVATAFEEKVHDAVCSIPRGRVTTYSALGRMIGCRSPRAVGQALRRDMGGAPCHRVIKGDLTLGGWAGEDSGPEVMRKEALLKKDGVVFVEGKLASKDLLWEG